MKVKWKRVEVGQIVELGGREWTVEKHKPKGKRILVAVRSGSYRDEAKVDPDVKVTIVERKPPKPKKASSPAKPPKPAHGDPWETQSDRIERKLDEILGAKLVGESVDGGREYYVPMVDVTTVAGHLAIFHAGEKLPDWAHDNEDQMMIAHARAHTDAVEGKHELATMHWHTEQRPTPAKGRGKKR